MVSQASDILSLMGFSEGLDLIKTSIILNLMKPVPLLLDETLVWSRKRRPTELVPLLGVWNLGELPRQLFPHL